MLDVLALQASNPAGGKPFDASVLVSMARQLLYLDKPQDTLELIRLALDGVRSTATHSRTAGSRVKPSPTFSGRWISGDVRAYRRPVARFLCFTCRRPITLPARKIPLPPPNYNSVAGAATPADRIQPPRMPRGAYSANHHPEEFSGDPPGLVIHPDDAVGMLLHPDASRLGGCCGISDMGGPNLVCAGCGVDLATHQADCYGLNQITLVADAVILSYVDD